MGRTKKSEGVTKVAEMPSAIVFKANKPLSKVEFNVISDMIKQEQAKTGLEIVLMPFSCDLIEEKEV